MDGDLRNVRLPYNPDNFLLRYSILEIIVNHWTYIAAMPKVFNSSVANMKREVHTYWLERRTNKMNL